MKFYEVQQKVASARWAHMAFFKTKKSAEKWAAGFNTEVEVYPVRVVEREFLG